MDSQYRDTQILFLRSPFIAAFLLFPITNETICQEEFDMLEMVDMHLA